ncbi:carboxypeptidase-like regulatory domain-containing protein [Flavobacterium terrisoli]|uniref:carboxypeptidase-like regulatory domain-containing protein n=1 Tax=Flavobacterium terrisoli TaxID=3242195 RepID=UPI002543F6B1|nr:carboxypeptidase-like regulatory domain-containing protein [Flavobacterium buctense]
MKYKSLLILFLLGSTYVSYAQNITVKGVVKDLTNLLPIPGANIGTLKSNFSTISNDEGAFEFVLPKVTDTLKISAMGYKDFKIALTAIKDNEFYLESKINDLEEVIIVKGGMQDLLELIIETSKEKFTTPIVMNSYFREFVRVNDRFTKFSDGELDYLLNHHNKKLVSDLNVKQARAYKIPKMEEDGNESVFDDIKSAFNIDELPGNVDNFRFLERTILKNKDFKKYEFILKSKKDGDGNEMMTLYFNPIDSVEEHLFKGFVTYDPKTNLIYSVSFQKDAAKIKYANDINLLLFRFTILENDVKANYKMSNGSYVMSNLSVGFKFNVKKKNKFDDNIELKMDMVVTNFTKDTSGFDLKKVYEGKSLFEFGTHFTTPFWKNNNAILLTDKEEKIIRDLEAKSQP